MVKLTSTKNYGLNGVTVLVYGAAGIGKTCLCATLPDAVIISAEQGLLSLSSLDIPVIEVGSVKDLEEAYEFLTTTDQGKAFKSICLDSISEIAEICLSAEKEKNSNQLKAYGNMNDQIDLALRKFVGIKGRTVYMSAKLDKAQDETGRILYSPAMPGQKLGLSIPYKFDGVYAMRMIKNQAGEEVRALQTQPDGSYLAKDRSGMLDKFEPADLGSIIEKINNGCMPSANN